jgi:hypothetical protein
MTEAAKRLAPDTSIPKRVFLSHDSADLDAASKIANFLRLVLGIEVLQPSDSPDCAPWSARRRKRLADSDAMIVLASPVGLTSELVLGEIGAAWSMEKPIVALTSEYVTSKPPLATADWRVLPLAQSTDPAAWRRVFAVRRS